MHARNDDIHSYPKTGKLVPVNNDEELLLKIRNQISGVTGWHLKKIDVNMRLIADLLMDSVEMIDLLMRLEEAGYVVPESRITTDLTVNELVQICHEQAGLQSAG